ncbi:MAG: hypothetical protein NUV57_05355 [archaeon]|nr:hypothetical protein [archaeon]
MLDRYIDSPKEIHVERHISMELEGLLFDIKELNKELARILEEKPELDRNEKKFIEKQVESLRKELTGFEIKIINVESLIGEKKSEEFKESVKNAFSDIKKSINELTEAYDWKSLGRIGETII